jgi:hypothetical protein
MPDTVAESLRRQAQECLRISQATSDPAVKNELLSAAAWLHEEAIKIEKLLSRGKGGGGPGAASQRPRGNRSRASFPPRSSPRYQLPASARQSQAPSYASAWALIVDASTSDTPSVSLAIDAKDRGIRLLMISGSPKETELFQNRADQLLWKPFRRADLERAIQHALASHTFGQRREDPN